MKKISIILAALAACFAVSCTKEAPTTELQDPSAPAGMKKVTITAISEGATKTSYTDNGEGVGVFSWTEGDQISVMGNDYNFYTLTTEQTGTSVSFSGYIPEEVTLRQEAFFPAAEHYREGSSYYFHIPEYKDMSEHFSADLPMGAYSGTETYQFKHITGAALLTFTNFPTDIETAEIAIVNTSLKLSGIFGTWIVDGLWVYGVAGAANESEGKFVRKVPVTDGQAQVYLPYACDGNLWSKCNVSITGYDSKGTAKVLLAGKTMNSFSTFGLAQVVPCSPLELPDYVPPVEWNAIDWTGSNVISPEVLINDETYGSLTAVKAVADANYLYVKVTAPSTSEWDTLYYDFARGETDSEEGKTGFWGWPTKYEFRNYASGSVTPNSLSVKYNGVSVDTNTTLVGDEICWQMAFPRYAHEVTAESGDIYLGIVAYHGGSVFVGAAPHTWGPMAKITLP